MKSLLSLLAIVVVCGAVYAGSWLRQLVKRQAQLVKDVEYLELRLSDLDLRISYAEGGVITGDTDS